MRFGFCKFFWLLYTIEGIYQFVVPLLLICYLILNHGPSQVCDYKAVKKKTSWLEVSLLPNIDKFSSNPSDCEEPSFGRGTYMLHHSVLQVLPPVLPLFWIREDDSGGAVSGAFSQFLPIVLYQGGPAHQLHSGELFQKFSGKDRGTSWELLHSCQDTFQHLQTQSEWYVVQLI